MVQSAQQVMATAPSPLMQCKRCGTQEALQAEDWIHKVGYLLTPEYRSAIYWCSGLDALGRDILRCSAAGNIVDKGYGIAGLEK
jgi:hypothetical protein